MTSAIANHLWQSTVFALAATTLAASLRGNRARVRHGIWVVASLKWFVPFSGLMTLGGYLNVMSPAAPGGEVSHAMSVAVHQMAEPFQASGTFAANSGPASVSWMATTVVVFWAFGALLLVVRRFRSWFQIRAAVRQGAPVDIVLVNPGLEVRSASGVLEPGVVGIWRPVLLLPSGIEHQLTPSQLQAVVAHEQCHVHRRDNLTAAVHMAVESVFWFHPLVWWIGARLVEERERACDEAVLSLGVSPRDYAEGIVNVCKNYVESPIACVSGVTGSNLTRRIEDIMMNRIGNSLTVARTALLVAAAVLTVAVPLGAGALTTPLRTSIAAPNQQSTPTANLAAVVEVMLNPAATAADRERLIGKTYSGTVTVQAVRLSSQPGVAASVWALPNGPGYGTAAGDTTPIVGFRFAIAADEPALQQLRKDKTVRVRGTLTGFSTEQRIGWAEFKDLVIEGSISSGDFVPGPLARSLARLVR